MTTIAPGAVQAFLGGNVSSSCNSLTEATMTSSSQSQLSSMNRSTSRPLNTGIVDSNMSMSSCATSTQEEESSEGKGKGPQTESTTSPNTTSISTITSNVTHGFTIQHSPTRKRSSATIFSGGTSSSTSSKNNNVIQNSNSPPASHQQHSSSMDTSTQSYYGPYSYECGTGQSSSSASSASPYQSFKSSALDALATLASSVDVDCTVNVNVDQKLDDIGSGSSISISISGEMSDDADADASSDDRLRMPPPPPRSRHSVCMGMVGRKRSASNPEGMEKWDAYGSYGHGSQNQKSRMHFVLPSSILEEELEHANFACEEHEKKKTNRRRSNAFGGSGDGDSGLGVQVATGNNFGVFHMFQNSENGNGNVTPLTAPLPLAHMNMNISNSIPVPVLRTARTDFSITSQPDITNGNSNGLYGTSPTTVVSLPNMKMKANRKSASASSKNGSTKKKMTKKKSPKSGSKNKRSYNKKNKNTPSSLSSSDEFSVGGNNSSGDTEGEDTETEEEIDESKLEPEELLRRARSKLFEDLTSDATLEKGVMPFPHSLEKYKEIYNKNGRIGIYTPAERAAIISKFNSKRTRRTWKKKIRYNCRKNLADRRMRVKGRFVKRAVEAADNNKENGKKNTNKDKNKTTAISEVGKGAAKGESKTTTATNSTTAKKAPQSLKKVFAAMDMDSNTKFAPGTAKVVAPASICTGEDTHIANVGVLATVTPAESGSDTSRASSPINISHPLAGKGLISLTKTATPSTSAGTIPEDMEVEMEVVEEDNDMGIEMPDFNDPDAGFKPTDAQPFRRTRRHTIT
eukprot:CAMPEP_0194125094 /NCGR_PEP_ID=MMETSP0150-20130528/59282_1 /TAXON_ID=122233 /ORGANISM="Chaetoceros debilis, Strain MM31A-1" /LENGTH=800 /DNA_ID=CAMNT_0038818885 /DNA_START=703 /DNA_END=3105 /DNA_ORIENTATION=-